MEFVSLFLPVFSFWPVNICSLVFVSDYFVVGKVHYINGITYRINVHYFVIHRSDFTTKLFALPPSLQATRIESVDPS